jgi:leukotriene-A4 hydrolase
MTNERTRLFYDPNSLSSFNGYRIIHTYFDLNVNFDSNILEGHVQLDVKPLDNKSCDRSSSITTENKEIPNNHGNKLVLDSRHLNIKQVLLKSNDNEKILPFQVDTERESLIIELSDISKDSIISILISYSTSNTKCTALQWLTKEQTADRQYPYMFSQCQAIHARSLYPCQDTPGVKSTYSAKITCPKPLTVVNTRKNITLETAFYFLKFHPNPSSRFFARN